MSKLRFYGICMLAMLVMPGCKKETPAPAPQTAQVILSVRHASTRTVLGQEDTDGFPVLWEASDQIWVRSAGLKAGKYGAKFTTDASCLYEGGKLALFSGETLESGPYVAVYPWSAVDASSDNRTIVLNIPEEQSWKNNSFGHNANLAAALWKSGDEVTFQGLAGALKLSLKGHASVSRVELIDKDESFPLWGKCTLTVEKDGSDFESFDITNDSPRRNRIILNCVEGIKLSSSASDLYFVVPAGAFARGFTLNLYDSTGQLSGTVESSQPCVMQANCLLPVTIEQPPFSGGSGTAADPNLISTAEDLMSLAELCNGDDHDVYASRHYLQTADIDMNGVDTEVIGKSSAKAFSGVYDGGNHTIGNLSPKPASDGAAGLFGYLSGATVKDLKIDGYTNNGTAGMQGVVAGQASSSTIQNISVNARVHFAKCACGGIVGYLEGGSVSGCSVTGFIQNEDYGDFQGVTVVSCVGGIAGYMENASLSDCSFQGEATSAGEQLGGIVGQIKNGTVDGCRVLEGSAVTGNNYYVGGIAGEMLTGGTISNCEVQSSVACRYPGAGGIVGWIQNGSIRDCVVGSLSNIRTGMDQTGGIAGYVYWKNTKQEVTIDGCVVYGDVAASYTVGGIVGEYNPTDNASYLNVTNCAFIGGQIVEAGYASGKWTMIGGIVAWARMGSTTATLNIVNCFSDPAEMRCDFPQAKEMDLGGFIGEQGGANASVNISGCYTTLTPARAVLNGSLDFPSGYYNYGAIVGLPNTLHITDVYYSAGFDALGKASSTSSLTRVEPVGTLALTDDTLLAKLNAFKSAYSGSFVLRNWVAGADGSPVLEGMQSNPSVGKKRPLRVSLIGDSLSTFNGYTPHNYHSSKASNGYRCHYPTSDGNVTSVAQTYWYMLTTQYLHNAVWDTNLAFSGTAVTRCTDSSKSDQYWYGQDFCTRYIENGGMGSPDIIIINGGANDWAHGIYNMLGSQKLERYPSGEVHRPGDAAMNAAYAVADAAKTLDEAKALPDATFGEAYLKLVRMMTLQYPHVKIVVLIHDTLTPDVEEALLHIAAHYGNCRAVDLYAVNGFNDFGWDFEYLLKGYQPNMPKHDLDWNSITKTGDLRKNCSDHYSAQAMKFIAEKIYNELGSWLEAPYNESGDGSINNFDNINGQW